MQITNEDRRKELRSLLDRIQQYPERDWSEELKRVTVLRHMLAKQKDDDPLPTLH